METDSAGSHRSYLLIDFARIPDEVADLFRNLRTDLDKFFLYLSAYYRVTLHPRESLIIFDEVQTFPLARAFVKYLVADGRYDYIETGVKLAERKSSKFAMGDFYSLLNRFHCQTLRSFAQYHSTLGETRLHPDRRQNVWRSSPL